ncbi:RNA-directed DNA polymerase, eukaryota [Tanacetum coccineum]|uniref:RNA-directed DNA polymerase, eukaryota n=1 Tax=Tanacetum coccineum TaxID=301880 RepID=A0ABQ4WPW7_9ASTR
MCDHGHFNEVRSEQERYGSVFNVQSAIAFNNFISLASLIDLPFDGYAYTWVHKSANKMSKLDRFLISKGLMASFPHLSALYGFDKLVEDTWMHLNIEDSNGMIKLKKKLQALKIIIKEWQKKAKKCSYKKKSSIQSKLSDFDKILDQGGSNEVIINDRSILLKELQDIISMESEEVAQKTKLVIRGVLMNGDWIVKPNAVKSEFLKHFSSQFDLPNTHRICLADEFNNRLSLEQQEDLKRNVTIKEIKRAVWDYGTNKSPGPYEFTFEFFDRYWEFLKNDISTAFIDFFSSDGLISDVQSSFVSNHQILDGPFILNELLSWCKYKKFKVMVFKEDFEKAFDSIRTIKVIHGEKGTLGSLDTRPRRSSWLEIVREINILRSKGIDILSLIRKKVGNGEDTLFLEDIGVDGITLKQQ